MDAAFGDFDGVRRQVSGERFESAEVRGDVFPAASGALGAGGGVGFATHGKAPAVDAADQRPGGQGLDLRFVVALEEHFHAERAGQFEEVPQLIRAEQIGHQQNRVGAEGAGLVDLVVVENEVLAQHRLGAAQLGSVEPLDAHAEVAGVGEHRKRADDGAGLVSRGRVGDVFRAHRALAG